MASTSTTEQQQADAEPEGYMLGIDEAGRGPVLGPMVYGTCYCPISKLDELIKMGFADSKQLSEPERERLFEVIKESDWLGWKVDVISARDMSAKMLRLNKYNLNSISFDSAMGLIRAVLARGVALREVYVDTVGDPKKYQDLLTRTFPGIKFVVAKKADDLYPIVSAASICAKVTRDTVLRDWSFGDEGISRGKKRQRDDAEDEEQEDDDEDEPSTAAVAAAAAAEAEFTTVFGSGYPGDPNTKKWLRANLDPVFGFPSLVRFSWKTSKKLLEERGVPVDWGDSDDEDDRGRGGRRGPKQAKLTSMLPKANESTRYDYFKKNNLSVEIGLAKNRRPDRYARMHDDSSGDSSNDPTAAIMGTASVRSRSNSTDDDVHVPPLSSYSCLGQERRAVWMFLEYPSLSRAGQLVALSIVLVIVLSIVVFCVASLPRHHDGGSGFQAMEYFAMITFTLEYLIRLGCAPRVGSFVLSPVNVIDLVAFLPFWVQLMANMEHNATGLATLRMARVVRLVRVFSVSKYKRPLKIFGHAIYNSTSALILLIFFLLMAVVIFACAIFFAERGEWSETNHAWVVHVDGTTELSGFQSIPDSMWFVMVTVTTVGYGDQYPLTAAGKVLASFSMIIGILILALPVTIVGVNFAHVYQEEMAKQKLQEGLDSDSESERVESRGRRRRSGGSLELSDLESAGIDSDLLALHSQMRAQMHQWSIALDVIGQNLLAAATAGDADDEPRIHEDVSLLS